MTAPTILPLVCAHCGTPIAGRAFIEKEGGFCLGEERYLRDTCLDGSVAGIEAFDPAGVATLQVAADELRMFIGKLPPVEAG